MEARYAFRKSQLLDECQVAPEMFEQVIPRLYTFMKPFVSIFQGQAADQHAKTYVCGLLSNVEHKNIESIAYRFGQSRLPLARLHWLGRVGRRAVTRESASASRGRNLARARWSAGVRPVGSFRQEGAGVGGRGATVVRSPGQARELPGSRVLGLRRPAGEHTLTDTAAVSAQRMDQGSAHGSRRPACPTCRGALSPRGMCCPWRCWMSIVRYCPHRWVAGDDEMGRSTAFRPERCVIAKGEQYLLAIPSNTTAPRSGERRCWSTPVVGRHPQLNSFVDGRGTGLGPSGAACRNLDISSMSAMGAKGPLAVEAVKRRVLARTERAQHERGRERSWCSATVTATRHKVVKVDYYLSNAVPETPAMGVGPGGQSGTSHRRMSPAEQERSRFGRL